MSASLLFRLRKFIGATLDQSFHAALKALRTFEDGTGRLEPEILRNTDISRVEPHSGSI